VDLVADNGKEDNFENKLYLHQSPTKPVVPNFHSELLSGQWRGNSFAENRPEFAQLMANRISGV
jgi:hypothetical protein